MPSSLLLACHLIPAVSATVSGAVMVARPKGTAVHQRLGTLWAVLMLLTALTSFAMTGGPLAIWQGYSVIHLLSVLTLFAVPLGIIAARRQWKTLHRFTMTSLYVALCITGVLALLMKGRFLNGVLF